MLIYLGLRAALVPSADGAEDGGGADATSLRHVVHEHRRNDHDRLGTLKGE